MAFKVLAKTLLKDASPDHKIKTEVKVVEENHGLGLAIHVNGYGTHDDEDSAPIFIEVLGGILRVIVWDDAKEQDPQVITLQDAAVLVKPQRDDYLQLIGENHTAIGETLERMADNRFKVIDDHGEEFIVVRDEPNDNDLRRAWKLA